MRKDWKDELRNSLENFQAPEPEGLWSAVQQGLPASRTEAAAAGEGRNSWRILTPLSLALACAAALLIILLPPAAREGELQVVHVIEPKHDETVLNDSQTLNRLQTDKRLETASPLQFETGYLSSAQPVTTGLSDNQQPQQPQELPAESQPKRSVTQPQPTSPDFPDEQPASNEQQDLPAESQPKRSVTQPQSAPQDLEEEQLDSNEQQDLLEVPQQSLPHSISRRKPAINLIAMASGSLSSQSSVLSYGALPGSDIATSLNSLSYSDFAYRNFSSLVTSNLGSEVSTHTIHRQPVRFAIEAELMLNKRLGLVSGLCYTRLVSDLTSGGENFYHTVQKLDYLGIPLRLNWHLLDSRDFTFYAGVGAMAEKCVAGSAMTSYSLYGQSLQGERLSVMDQPLVFSLDTSLGLGIGLWNSASLVIEPGLSWHIPDGGTLRNIYRDRPLNFSLSIALRYRL